LNRFVNATEGLCVKCDVAYLAAGTGNDFLCDIGRESDGKPFSVKKYLQDLPVVEVKGKSYRFLNNVGFGIDGYCCEVGDKKQAAKPGKPVNYTAIAIMGLLFHFRAPNARVTVDGVTKEYRRVWIAPAMKGRYYGGGMMVAPAQDRLSEDGTLSSVVFYGKGRLKTLMVFPSIFKGEHINHPEMVDIRQGHTITVEFDRPTALQIDGETVLGVTSYTVKSKLPALV
jgi:diacylglycerol kinase family enzyme